MITSPNTCALTALRRLGTEAYRIDWFGDVRNYGRTGGRLSLVSVVMSRWRGVAEAADPQHPRQAITILVPMAFLRLLRIGDIWADGILCGSDQTICREEFLGTEITDGAFDVKPAGFPMLGGDRTIYPLPFEKINTHRGHTGACCVRVNLNGNATLIIPCMEMIRFYFGASGALLSRLFSGAIGSQRLFTSARISPTTGIGNLNLAHGLPGVAAATVGRIAFDNHALKAMNWIVNSGTSAAANRARYYPKTTFPFRGKTDLTVEGRWLEHRNYRVFLAERLLRCSHPFPFKTLFYTSQVNLLASRSTFQKPRGSSSSRPTGETNRHNNDAIALGENTVTPDLQAYRIDVVDNTIAGPFPDLLQKHIRRVRPNLPGLGSRAAKQTLGELAAGEECATGVGRAAEVTTEEEVPAEAIEVFMSAFQSLKESGAIRARLASTNSVGSLSTPEVSGFSRTDFLAKSSNNHLAEIWYTWIEIDSEVAGHSLLALVRDHVNQETLSHIALIRHRPEDTSNSVVVQHYCTAFAEGQFDKTGDSSIAGILDTAGAMNIFQVSKFLEATINAEHKRG